MLNSGFDGSGRPLNLRLPPIELIQLEMEQDKFYTDWDKVIQRKAEIKREPYLYNCGAGLSSFHIDPYGQLSLCLMARQRTFSLRQGSFREGWDQFLFLERFHPDIADRPCPTCDLKAVCTQCPAWSQVEHGNSYQKVTFLCEVAQARADALHFSDIAPGSRL
jgi:radical SAM protein with 4Fe4S-binding SPASM domain